jgi:hypothetical protein
MNGDGQAMAIFSVSGDTAELLRAYDRASETIERGAGDPALEGARPDHHAVCATGEGMMVVDLWSSRSGMRRFLEWPGWREALAAEGIPDPEVRTYAVHRAAG